MNRKRSFVIMCVTGVLLLAGCQKSTAKNDNDNLIQTEKTKTDTTETDTTETVNKKITAAQAYERMQSGDPVVIVDVRTKEEYDAGYIPGAVLIPNEEIGEEKPELLPVEDAEILVYCRSGNRSAKAAVKLEKLGYTNISDFGGINDWPYEIEM